MYAICLFCLESASQIKVNDIVSYFDEGGNVVIIGDIDTDRSFRKLFYAFGIELDQYVIICINLGIKTERFL